MRLFTLLALALVSIPQARASTEYTFIKADPEKKIVYTNPVWSPVGNSIAYVAARNSTKVGANTIWNCPKDLWLATFSNGHWKHRLLVKGGNGSAWSRDGKRLAITRKGLAVLDLRTGKVRQLTKDYIPGVTGSDEGRIRLDFPISFSPNGRYVVYDRQLYESGEYRVFDLERGRDTGVLLGECPTWSADSKYVFSAFNWHGDWPVQTRLVRTDIESRKSQTVLPHYRIDWLALPGENYAWALVADLEPRRYPEQTKYPKDELNPPEGPGIYRLDLTSLELKKLSDIKEPIILNRDLGRFAFITESRPADLYIGETRHWQFRIVAKDVAEPWLMRTIFASWSSDGKSLAYVTPKGDIRIVKFP